MALKFVKKIKLKGLKQKTLGWLMAIGVLVTSYVKKDDLKDSFQINSAQSQFQEKIEYDSSVEKEIVNMIRGGGSRDQPDSLSTATLPEVSAEPTNAFTNTNYLKQSQRHQQLKNTENPIFTTAKSDFPEDDSSDDESIGTDFDTGVYLNENNQPNDQDANLLDDYLGTVEDNHQSQSSLDELPPIEVPLEHEISDSDEDFSDSFDYETDRKIYTNGRSKGHKTAKEDDYSHAVKKYKYESTPERGERLLRREVFANKNEKELFETPRTAADLKKASEVKIDEGKLTDKLWRRPSYFGLERPDTASRSSSPRKDFFAKHGPDAVNQLKDHLTSDGTRCIKGLYREHTISYDHYYNRDTGNVVLVQTNELTNEQEVLSFWPVNSIQRVELLNHGHIHKDWQLAQDVQNKLTEENNLTVKRNQELEKQRQLNQAVSPTKAAKRAGEQIQNEIESTLNNQND